MIKILDSTDGKFYSVITGRNGEIVYTSEIYTRKDAAIESADAIVEMIRSWEEPEMMVGDFTRRKKPGPKPKENVNGVINI